MRLLILVHYPSGLDWFVSLPTIAALHQANYATIPDYLETELRYMDAGE
jgi:hypothetical protein